MSIFGSLERQKTNRRIIIQFRYFSSKKNMNNFHMCHKFEGHGLEF